MLITPRLYWSLTQFTIVDAGASFKCALVQLMILRRYEMGISFGAMLFRDEAPSIVYPYDIYSVTFSVRFHARRKKAYDK